MLLSQCVRCHCAAVIVPSSRGTMTSSPRSVAAAGRSWTVHELKPELCDIYEEGTEMYYTAACSVSWRCKWKSKPSFSFSKCWYLLAGRGCVLRAFCEAAGDEMLLVTVAHIVKSNAKWASIKWVDTMASGAELWLKDIWNLLLHSWGFVFFFLLVGSRGEHPPPLIYFTSRSRHSNYRWWGR